MIPTPLSCEAKKGLFNLNRLTNLVCATPSLINFAENHLYNQIHQTTGIYLLIEHHEEVKENVIRFILQDDPLKNNESYELNISADCIELKGTRAGLLYAVESLCLLLENKNNSWSWPCLEIKDEPAFEWRGLMLDCSRHFIRKEYILYYIDIMCRLKMNRLHLHINDDQGWRMEINSHPELTKTGGFVKEGSSHQGFYTHKDLREIIAYAKLRNVMVIPEIEIPGHAFAAMQSYPWLCCTGKPETNKGHQNDLYCAGKESTFEFLIDVFQEIVNVFSAPYIHIGGDEAPKDKWRECSYCQNRIKKEKLKDEEELQAYMIRRITEFLHLQEKQVIGWDEVLDGKPDQNLIVQWWRHRNHGNEAPLSALKKGHKVIASPNSFCYLSFPMKPDENFALERTSTLQKVYEAELIPPDLNEAELKNILGIECCIWTEYLTEEKIEKMLFPRILALAESMWRNPKTKNFEDFQQLVKKQESYWKRANVEFGSYD